MIAVIETNPQTETSSSHMWGSYDYETSLNMEISVKPRMTNKKKWRRI